MQTKLTLKLEESVIKRAKRYARVHRRSLSKMVEGYFRSVTREERKSDQPLPPIVSSLAGILKNRKKADIKEEYTNYLIKKYS
jgi:hypothetical protein